MSKSPLDPKAKKALQDMKMEIISELGIVGNYASVDKGSIKSRTNGKIGGSLGGTMTRRLVEMGERSLIDNNNKLES